MPGELYVGLMSGTSMDGIDAALVSIRGDNSIELIASHSHAWPAELKQELIALALPGDNEIDRMGEADAWAGEVMAEAVHALLNTAGTPASAVRAIGSHGQTIRHRPDSTHPFSLQIGDPNRIASLTGITTVADLRRRDIAHGGQGAPLAPAFHQAILGSSTETRVILNIGGIANVTLLPKDLAAEISGFDTGPGNRLLDDWVMENQGTPFDMDGAWAQSGTSSDQLLALLQGDAYFEQLPPKSTGTERFNLEWLTQQGGATLRSLAPEDVQATLLELTATTIAEAIIRHCANASRLLVCGGGVHNSALMQRLDTLLPSIVTGSTAAEGIDPDWMEAMAFAWLAYRTLEGKHGNLVAVTGAQQQAILGGIYPA